MVKLDEIINIVKEAGNILKKEYDSNIEEMQIKVKAGNRDLATKYDIEVQMYLINELEKIYPWVYIIGEEDTKDNGKIDESKLKDEFFLIDPIDGTTNLIHNFRHSSISVAYAKNGEVCIGIVLNPYTNELFYAEKYKGAFLNGKQIHVSDLSLKDSLVVFGTSPSTNNLTDRTFSLLRTIFDNAQDIRRTGSAALDLCYIASGRCDFFFELTLFPWDYAAGQLIITEAGGIVSDFNGNKLPYDKKSNVVAGNPVSYKEGIRLLNN